MRHAVVTGTSSGIGRAVAERLLRDGCRVTGLDRMPATLAHEWFQALEVDLADGARRGSVLPRLDRAEALVHRAGSP